MDVAAAIGMALALLVATVAIHYEVLSATFAGLPRLGVPPRLRILVAMAAIFGAHLAEITLYAVAFYGMERLQLGSIGGDFNGAWLDYFYFSTTSYTTMGVGDVAPHGLLRLVAGLEGLNGFVLIGWSASFTYVTMEAYWRGDSPDR